MYMYIGINTNIEGSGPGRRLFTGLSPRSISKRMELILNVNLKEHWFPKSSKITIDYIKFVLRNLFWGLKPVYLYVEFYSIF